MTQKFISVIIPVHNEKKNIRGCIESMLAQDYPRDLMEWIFVDGMSDDGTGNILEEFREKYPELISVLKNLKISIPCGINMGVARAKGDYIIRLDAHAEYAPDYLSKCAELLERTSADNVGGVMDTKARTRTGQIISRMLSCRFGVGGSMFRTSGKDGYVDTVPFGAFRRELFKRIGGFDERLTRNEDNEFNTRIIKGGGKIYLSNEIKLTYYCRESVPELLCMAYSNGYWNVVTEKLYPGSMRIRHFVPFLFVLSLLLMPVLSAFSKLFFLVFMAELILYGLLDLIFSIKTSDSLFSFFSLLFMFPLFHVSYGAGSLAGIVKILFRGL